MKHQCSLILAVSFMIFYNVASQHSDCEIKTGLVTKIDISGCEKMDMACVFARGTNVAVTIGFVLKPCSKEVTAVRAFVHGTILNQTVPLRFKNSNGCVDSGLRCPLQKGIDHEYKGVLEILNIYPQSVVSILWELVDQDNKNLAHVSIAARFE